MGRKLGNLAVVGPEHPGCALAGGDLGGVGQEARRRHDHRHALGDRCVVEDADVAVLDHLACLNESHRRAP